MNRKVGYIGFGNMGGGYHYETATRDDIPFTPIAVYDINPEVRKTAESRGLAVFDNIDDFLASKLFDFVVVATPNQYHCKYVCAALEAGYDVMCEKPVAMNVPELEKMIETSKRVGKLFTVHHNRRWDRDYIMLKQVIESGKIGKIHSIENRVHEKDESGQMFGWRMFADHGGGEFGDWGIHVLDQTLDLIREPVKSVTASIIPLNSHDEIDDYAKILITFESGLTAQVEASTCAPFPLPKWVAYGNRGAVKINKIYDDTGVVRYMNKYHFETENTTVYPDEKVSTRPFEKLIVDEWAEDKLPYAPVEQDWADLYKNVGDALDGTGELAVTPESVLRCFKVFEAALISSKEKRSVQL